MEPVSLLIIFINKFYDIPQHRRFILFTVLAKTLFANEFQHIYPLLLLLLDKYICDNVNFIQNYYIKFFLERKN